MCRNFLVNVKPLSSLYFRSVKNFCTLEVLERKSILELLRDYEQHSSVIMLMVVNVSNVHFIAYQLLMFQYMHCSDYAV